jgi:hypothetical protein
MRDLIRLVVFAALLWIAPAAPAVACSCIGGPLFAGYRSSTDVFTGRVLSVRRDPTSEYQREIARIAVQDVFKGTASGEVEIAGYTGGMCGYPFKEGADYLIFAESTDLGLTAELCSRTRRLQDAGADLEYLDALRSGRTGATVWGQVKAEQRTLEAYRALQDLPLVLTSASDRFEVAIDPSNMCFEFHFVPPGSYSLDLPDADVLRFVMIPPPLLIAPRTITVAPDADEVQIMLTVRKKN